MNDFSHLLYSLSYTLDDPRVPEAMRKAADEIDRLRAALRAALSFIDANVADPDITDEMAKAWGELWDTNPRAALGEKA